MFDFDVRTALVVVGLLYVLMAIIAWIVLTAQRSLPVALWCVGGVLFGLATLLTGMQGNIPEWVTFIVVNLFFYAGNLLRIQSLRLDLLKPWKFSWIVLASLSIVMIFNGIHYQFQDPALRGQFTSLAGAALVGYLANLSWQIGRAEHSRSAKWIAWVYWFVALAMVLRAVTLIGYTGPVGLPSEQWTSGAVTTLALLVSAVVGHIGYVGLHLDRSMRRELKTVADSVRDEESRRLVEQIAQLDRQRSLGEMSASLGHELNQPLTAILTNAQVARRGLQSRRFGTDEHTEFLDKIIQNTQRASQIIERIRGFIRPLATRSEPVNLNLIIVEVAELVAAEARNHKVSLVLPSNIAALQVTGDPIQISQIIVNVLRNAIDAVKQVAHREIHLWCERADGRAILSIRDSGPGLTAEDLIHVGTAFFTTKTTGLGMGLAISRSIAAQHGGTLSISNAAVGGAVVELNLPALAEVRA
jgi:signal transduction histidine kinase